MGHFWINTKDQSKHNFNKNYTQKHIKTEAYLLSLLYLYYKY